MAGQATYFLANSEINAELRGIPYTPPGTGYLALFSVAPTRAGGGTEIVGNGYVRQAITMGAPANGVSSNSAQVNFPDATPAGYTVNGWAIFDAIGGGNQLFNEDTSGAPKTIAVGNNFKVAIGSLIVTR